MWGVGNLAYHWSDAALANSRLTYFLLIKQLNVYPSYNDAQFDNRYDALSVHYNIKPTTKYPPSYNPMCGAESLI